jgi:hypothetical protein
VVPYSLIEEDDLREIQVNASNKYDWESALEKVHDHLLTFLLFIRRLLAALVDM